MAIYNSNLVKISVLALQLIFTFGEDGTDGVNFEKQKVDLNSFSKDIKRSNNYSSIDDINVNEKLVNKYSTKSGLSIGVFDGVLSNVQLRILGLVATFNLGYWTYQLQEDSVVGGQKRVDPYGLPWAYQIDTAMFSETLAGNRLKKVVRNFFGEGSDVYFPYMVTSYILRCGDSPKLRVDAESDDDEVSMMIYLKKKWQKNYYGDLYLYDDDQEIAAGVFPRYGRIVVWQSSIPYLPRPPSVRFRQGQILLHLRFTKDERKYQNAYNIWLNEQRLRKSIQDSGFFVKSEKDQSTPAAVDVEEKLTAKAKSKEGKKIFVFDGLFDNDTLANLRSLILSYGVYFYDDSYDKESDNVQWIAGFSVDKYVQSRMWEVTKKVATFASGGLSEWFPYDVSCNLIRSSDTTQIHHDCEYGEEEWTFLLYLNPSWSINDYGETVYYERNQDDTEIITEVRPKYGRVVIFEGIIPHSARPPSRNFTGARLSFAVKLSKNERLARIKGAQEELRHLNHAMFVKEQIEKRSQRKVDDVDDGKNLEDIDIGNFEMILKDLSTQTDEDVETSRKVFNEVSKSNYKLRGFVDERLFSAL